MRCLSPRFGSCLSLYWLTGTHAVGGGEVELLAGLDIKCRVAVDNGLTQEQASETLTHIAFYAGPALRFFGLARGERGIRETEEVSLLVSASSRLEAAKLAQLQSSYSWAISKWCQWALL